MFAILSLVYIQNIKSNIAFYFFVPQGFVSPCLLKKPNQILFDSIGNCYYLTSFLLECSVFATPIEERTAVVFQNFFVSFLSKCHKLKSEKFSTMGVVILLDLLCHGLHVRSLP